MAETLPLPGLFQPVPRFNWKGWKASLGDLPPNVRGNADVGLKANDDLIADVCAGEPKLNAVTRPTLAFPLYTPFARDTVETLGLPTALSLIRDNETDLNALQIFTEESLAREAMKWITNWLPNDVLDIDVLTIDSPAILRKWAARFPELGIGFVRINPGPEFEIGWQEDVETFLSSLPAE
jgi:hypothetical protein